MHFPQESVLRVGGGAGGVNRPWSSADSEAGLDLRVPQGTKHGTVQRLRGEGPARLGGKGRGDIRYRFVIDVPDKLSPEQDEAIDRLSKVMNGNPRADLFSKAKAGGTQGKDS